MKSLIQPTMKFSDITTRNIAKPGKNDYHQAVVEEVASDARQML